jgi:hypothetical protein
MKRFVILAALAAATAFASAEHTVMWYVGHPAEMKRVLAACNNDPGDAKNKPDCENVFQAELVFSSAEAERRATPFMSPANPRYWRLHPDELPFEIFICAKLVGNPAAYRANFCDSAMTAAGR